MPFEGVMPELKFFPETHVAFVSEIGPYKKSISRGFKRLFDWLETNGIQPNGPLLAILYDDPSKVAPENQRSDLCAPVGPHVDGSGDVRTKEIGGWKVATISYEGEKNASRALKEVYDWLRDQGYSPADVPVAKYLSQLNEKARAEIGVPVIKRELMPGTKKSKSSSVKRARTRSTATRKGTARKTTRRTAK
jgi:DNA gyrase inhibitor GyrI